ncbi:conserved Plasmodium protein, unknown function [Plasmodium ovale]|uniref:Nucleoplasmin-like domain-containing protein n=2 Tax=Plasmodium ovale TaxID=36330 RepID=A0A1A8X1Y0_PLAOA|nr:conserved Plasmodium protein, unknown function [Plasmodium ovale curtisi]SCQ16900.1 conserved Plasmodium protein, unknown function [Plasmodium ovale]
MMFYGKVIKAEETIVPEPKDGYSVIHLSRACLNNPEDEGKLYVQVEDANGCYNICCLQKNVCEDTPLDIFLMIDNGVKVKTSGSKNEVHLVGYYEVSFGQDNLDDDDDEDFEEEDEFENEEVKILTRKNTLKNSLSNGFSKKKKDAAANGEDDETNVGKNEEDDDEDDDDDDDEEEDDEEEDDEEDEDEEEEEEEEEEEDEEEEEEEVDAEEEEEDDDEEVDEDDEEDEEEDDEDGTKKKNLQKKGKNKRSLDNKNDEPSKKSKLGDESQYEKDLVAFLKKNGKSKLTELGKVKKPDGLKMKLGMFIKKHSNVFKYENEGQIVSLK